MRAAASSSKASTYSPVPRDSPATLIIPRQRPPLVSNSSSSRSRSANQRWIAASSDAGSTQLTSGTIATGPASDPRPEPRHDPLHPIHPPIRPGACRHRVVALGVEHVLHLAAQHAKGDEQLLVVGRRAAQVALALEDQERRV